MYVPLIPLKYAYLGYIRMANMTLASATFVFVVNIYYIETPGRPKRSRSGGATVLWLWEETHVPKVMVSNTSTVYWML